MSRLALLLTFVSATQAANWAILVAGSNQYYNYRHQADVCHAYQVLKSNGFSEDNIITLMYDDIAQSPENPVKGNLINEPAGPNVYEGVKKDYVGNDVTSSLFLKVLEGTQPGVGTNRVLAAGPDDDVFIFFSDHGATGLIAFPNDYLYATDLNASINRVAAKKGFRKLLFYVEACEAGSMFNGILSSNINVLAVTASDPTHSSYAIYYDNQRQTYLGDVFSVFWMQDSDKHSSDETVGQQFDIVKTETNTSAVCAYGDLTIKNDLLSKFQKPAQSKARSVAPLPKGHRVDSRDVPLWTLRQKLIHAKSEDRPKIAMQLFELVGKRSSQDKRFSEIEAAAAKLAQAPIQWAPVTSGGDICYENVVEDPACLKEMVGAVVSACGHFDDYSLKYVRMLNAVCNANLGATQMLQAIQYACRP